MVGVPHALVASLSVTENLARMPGLAIAMKIMGIARQDLSRTRQLRINRFLTGEKPGRQIFPG
jgi:hypothetical protein